MKVMLRLERRGRKPTGRTKPVFVRFSPESFYFMSDLGVNKSEFLDRLVLDYKTVFESRQLKFVDL